MYPKIESYFSILMLFGASQAFTGIYLLFKDKQRPYSNNMLALLLFAWGFSCYWFFAFIHKEPFFSVTLTTFIGPMLALTLFPPIYLYVKFMFYEYKKFQFKDHLHFLPIYIYLGFTLYLFISSDFSIANMREHEWYNIRMNISSYVATLQGPFYFIKTNRILKKRYQILQEQYSEIESRKLEWFHVINYSFALVFIIGGISAIIKITYIDPYLLYMAYHAVIAISIFYITLMIYKYPKLFSQPIPISEVSSINTVKPFEMKRDKESGVTHESFNKEAEIESEIIEKLDKLMKEKKLYKNPNFCLNDLATEMSEKRNAISYVLNHNLNKTFYNYINELRIEESKRLLSDKNLLHYTIEGVAAESGFKTMSVFYRFFKDMENVTPAVYRKSRLNL
ncbi:helix-turn-helix domain-containing protein [Aequorivita marina]|uniref:helix-turn-helix domain-containing protein n=1 Tax=Aequorivita marina TaxID=3073654 RepID=UPI002874F566|nr:helix-turn-helix domain-containing protein [Aequorivita sp. S2608]MDS1297897.1 helix-turn-helix domain-containing protein [Aequorivita sp. S2608]